MAGLKYLNTIARERAAGADAILVLIPVLLERTFGLGTRSCKDKLHLPNNYFNNILVVQIKKKELLRN